jgi:hypothetical protein
VVVRLGIVEARAQAANGLPMDSLGMWCRVAMEVAGGFHRVVEVHTREATFECMVEVVGCLVMGVLEWRFLPLFLVTKDLNSVMEFYKSCSFLVYVFPLGFGALNYCLLLMMDSSS